MYFQIPGVLVILQRHVSDSTLITMLCIDSIALLATFTAENYEHISMIKIKTKIRSFRSFYSPFQMKLYLSRPWSCKLAFIFLSEMCKTYFSLIHVIIFKVISNVKLHNKICILTLLVFNLL